MKHVDIYTDGACKGNPGPGGYAAILIYGKKEFVLSGFEPETTNNRMELTAAIEGIGALKEKCEVSLFSDSSYLTDAFNKGWIYNWENNGWKSGKTAVKNPDLFKRLLELSRMHNVTWIHVKGHADNEYNNRCDELAVNEYKKHLSTEEQAEEQAEEQVEEQAEGATEIDRDAPYTGPLEETVVSSKKRFSGKVFNVEERVVKLSDGSLKDREIVVHSGGSAIVAVDSDRKIYLVRQFRSAAGKVMLEIPAGKLEKGEDPLEAAVRELHEETGLVADPASVRKLGEFYGTPGYCSEVIHLYFVYSDLKAGAPHRDQGELLRCEKYDFEDALKMVYEGLFQDAKTVIGITLAASMPEIRRKRGNN